MMKVAKTYTPLIALILSSCVSAKKATHFADQSNGSLPSSLTIPQTIISPNDLLSITVTSLNSSASAVFNAPNVLFQNNITNQSNGPLQSSGYLVDAEGNIQFPMVGTIPVNSLTTIQLRDKITRAILDKKLLMDPIVTVRHLNFKVTVLGEVGNPTVMKVPSEKINLLEALGLADDITVFGKKDNIMVIREENGQKIFQQFDLTKSEIFNSAYYQLRSNDIVYVEPNRARVASSSRTTQFLPIILSGLSFSVFVFDRITR
jgi:polysaccharide biosynthesis/export protein